MRTPYVLIIALSSLAIADCGAGGSNGSETKNVIYAAARNIAPVVVATSSASALRRKGAYLAVLKEAVDMPWWSGNLGGLIFQTLRDYQYPRDEGKVDATNLYKVLFEAGNAYDGNAGLLDAMAVKAVAAPFDFGAFTIADTYDKGTNGVGGQDVFMAAREVGNEKHMLLAMKQGDGSNIMQGVYNGDTKDLELNSLTLIPYSSGTMAGDIYGIRSYIKGNETAHTFEFRFLQFSYNHTMDMYYYYSVIGKGVSQGTENHFLFYGTSSSTGGSGGSGNSSGYYCFAATDTETDYQTKFETYPPAMSGGGEIIDSGSPCYGYKTDPDGIDAQLGTQPLWGPSDITFDPTAFTGGGATHLELSL